MLLINKYRLDSNKQTGPKQNEQRHAEQARNNPQANNPFEQDNAQMLTQNDLERMMDRIEDLAKSGSQDAARQMLSELQRMMDNLRAGRHEQQRQAEGNAKLDSPSETVARQPAITGSLGQSLSARLDRHLDQTFGLLWPSPPKCDRPWIHKIGRAHV